MNSVRPSTRERLVSPAIEEAVGRDFMQRLRAAAARVQPMSTAVALAFAEGPEVSGGVDDDELGD